MEHNGGAEEGRREPADGGRVRARGLREHVEEPQRLGLGVLGVLGDGWQEHEAAHDDRGQLRRADADDGGCVVVAVLRKAVENIK